MTQGIIYISGVIGEDTNLIDVIRQVKAQKTATEYLVKIDSVGGYVDAGYAIYDYLKGLSVPVTTYTTKSYSIASIIFLAGQKRIIPEGASNALMIHLPWVENLRGTHDAITAQMSHLKAIENKLINFYSEALQIDKNTIQSLLQNETYLDAQQAKELGIATEIQVAAKAVAMINNEKEENESLMTKVEQKISAIYNKLFNVKAELVLQDATATPITFPDLNEGDTPVEGDKATVDGKPADGEYLMPDGGSIVCEKGLVKEIWLPVVEETVEELLDVEEDEESTENAPVEETDKDAKIAELEAKVAELEAKIAELEGADEAKAEEETESKVAEIMAKMLEQNEELEAKYTALAKMVGSDYQPEKKENIPAVKATEQEKPKFSIKRK
ncbi:MAG: hypothetical protein DI539_16125 [Flavobacterium psychrophilum]|nr:MAG: hypothetical protein DI539_16125 [Flavobacterium psychrophilum]